MQNLSVAINEDGTTADAKFYTGCKKYNKRFTGSKCYYCSTYSNCEYPAKGLLVFDVTTNSFGFVMHQTGLSLQILQEMCGKNTSSYVF